MTLTPRAGRLAALAALVLAPHLVAAQDAQQETRAGDLVIRHLWSRATPKGAQVAGGYLTIINNGTAPDTLTGGSAEVASKFELHDMTMAGGVMRMRPIGPLAIPPGATVTLSPSGRHIMMTGLKHGLKEGDTVDGTLTFEHAGSVPVHFSVEAIGAGAPGKADDAAPAGHSMPNMKM